MLLVLVIALLDFATKLVHQLMRDVVCVANSTAHAERPDLQTLFVVLLLNYCVLLRIFWF
jgi:hypothetical protein